MQHIVASFCSTIKCTSTTSIFVCLFHKLSRSLSNEPTSHLVAHFFELIIFWAISRKTRRCDLPLPLLFSGIFSTKITPPLRCCGNDRRSENRNFNLQSRPQELNFLFEITCSIINYFIGCNYALFYNKR